MNNSELIEAMLKSRKFCHIWGDEVIGARVHGPIFAYAAFAPSHIYQENNQFIQPKNIQQATIFYANVRFLAIKSLRDA